MRHGWEQQAVQFIANEQRDNGGFLTSLSSSHAQFYSKTKIHTIFTTALIVRFLHTVPNVSAIIDAASEYLLSQQHTSGAWNYWEADAPEQLDMPLPDDFDDTSCAFAALLLHRKIEIDGTRQAQLAKLLVAAESSTGGPYRTWIGQPSTAKWSDIDPVVNANIGYLLSLQTIILPSLITFFDTALAQNKLTSPYYASDVPTLFFLSEWYQGSQHTILSQKISKRLGCTTLNALELSLLILAAWNCRLAEQHIAPAQARLLTLLHPGGYWRASTMYIHRTSEGRVEYAGSAALTTACAIRAMAVKPSDYGQNKTSNTRPPSIAIMRTVKHKTRYMSDDMLRATYLEQVRATVLADKNYQITNPVKHITRAFDLHVPASTATNLNLGSLNGWIAYTIYDDFLDDEGRPADISIANVALRESLTRFRAALPHSKVFQSQVDTVFSVVDAANLWEVRYSRVTVASGILAYNKLPDYGDYTQLAERSWGHTLAAFGVLQAADITHKTETQHQLQQFFNHYLIARQLNDDAHDWETDLSNGHVTAVVAELLRAHGVRSVNIANDLPKLRQTYWGRVICTIATMIQYHAARAAEAVAKLKCPHPEALLAWLIPLERAANDAQQKHTYAAQFISTYTSLH